MILILYISLQILLGPEISKSQDGQIRTCHGARGQLRPNIGHCSSGVQEKFTQPCSLEGLGRAWVSPARGEIWDGRREKTGAHPPVKELRDVQHGIVCSESLAGKHTKKQ